MSNYTGFSDLCIPAANIVDLKPIIQEAIELGFRNLAIEQSVDLTEGVDNKKDPVPRPKCLKELKAEFGGQIRLLNRLTVIFAEASVSLVLNKSDNIRGYNLIAALPIHESSMQYACQTMTCDLITYDNNRSWVKLSRKFYFLAVERNIAFEILYGPCLANSHDRKKTITRSHVYHSYGKSKNVLISSGATNQFELRSPYDIANLGLIFGLSVEQSKEAIRDIPKRVLIAAEGRRFGKAGVVIFRRGRNDRAVDSDDYSDTELEENTSNDDDGVENEDENMSTEDDNVDNTSKGIEKEEDDTVELQPPRKMAKY